jgi:hypothetical protein
MIPGTRGNISHCLIKYYRGNIGLEKAWDVSRIATWEKDDVTISSTTDFYPSDFIGSHLTQRESLESKGVKLFDKKVDLVEFVGYNESSKAYEIYIHG